MFQFRGMKVGIRKNGGLFVRPCISKEIRRIKWWEHVYRMNKVLRSPFGCRWKEGEGNPS